MLEAGQVPELRAPPPTGSNYTEVGQLAEYEDISSSYENISWRYKGADGEQKTGPFAAKLFMADEE